MIGTHPCAACGVELCRISADRHTYPSLAIVLCPACGAVSNRCMPAFEALWRWFVRRRAAERALVWRLFLLLSMAAWLIYLGAGSVPLVGLVDGRHSSLIERLELTGLARFCGIALAVSWFASLTLQHLRPRHMIFTWGTLLCLVAVANYLVTILSWHINSTPEQQFRSDNFAVEHSAILVGGLIAAAVGTIALIPLADLAPYTYKLIDSARLRRKLAFARKERRR
ncbi:MAG: hypothetical protein EXS00_04515 [Phycisphaerales bacterium]|nr:hypothetical protein [Phycisphaerales bacterium]